VNCPSAETVTAATQRQEGLQWIGPDLATRRPIRGGWIAM